LGRQNHHLTEVLARFEVLLTKSAPQDRESNTSASQRIKQFLSGLITFSRVAKAASLLILLIGLTASIYDLRSRVSLAVGPNLQASDALSALFEVSNDGLLPIYDVKFTCSLGRLTFLSSANKSIVISSTSGYGSVISNSAIPVAPVIRSGQKATTNTFCPLRFPDLTLSGADFILVVSYKDVWRQTEERQFRLVTASMDGGRITWTQQPH